MLHISENLSSSFATSFTDSKINFGELLFHASHISFKRTASEGMQVRDPREAVREFQLMFN